MEKEPEAIDVRASEDESASEAIHAADEELEVDNSDVIEDDESDAKSFRTDETGSFMGVDDVTMSMVYSSSLPFPVSICSFHPPTHTQKRTNTNTI